MLPRTIAVFLPLLVFTISAPAQLSVNGNQLWRQGADGILGEDESNDRFGHDVATGDFNGDKIADVAIGVPRESSARGSVHVIYGAETGLTSQGNQVWVGDANGLQGDNDRNDVFGISVAAGDFNGDGFDDLAVGASGHNRAEGSVHVIYGSAAGLTSNGNQFWRQGRDGLDGDRDNGDSFGTDVAAGDFNGDGFDDLAMGAPGENSSGGLVDVIFGSQGGLTSNGSQQWRQGSNGLPGTRERGDLFGFVLMTGDFNGDGNADLAVGIPGEDGGEGRVDVIFGSSGGGLVSNGAQKWTQNEVFGGGNSENGDSFGSALTAGDFNSDSFYDLAVAAQGENSSRGDVTVIYGGPSGFTAAGAQQFRQGQNGVGGGEEERGDVFGSALAAGDGDLDGFDDLAIGVRGEDGNIGLVQVLRGAPGGITTDGQQVFAQGFDGLADQAESRDDFGFSLAFGDVGGDFAEDLIVGAPGEDNDRGVIHVILGTEAEPQPLISSVVGAGTSKPLVQAASDNAILSLFGDNFAAPNVFRTVTGSDLVNGRVPTQLDTWCVEGNGRRLPIFGVFDTPDGDQINLQASVLPGETTLAIELITNCGEGGEKRSNIVEIPAQLATPEFFFFQFNPDGVDPVAAVDATTFALLGPPALGGAFRAARPGDIVTVFITGVGETSPRFGPGELPNMAARTVLNARIFLGGTEITPLYVGVTGGNAGLYQANFEIPANTATGNLALKIVLEGPQGTFETPAGGFLNVVAP